MEAFLIATVRYLRKFCVTSTLVNTTKYNFFVTWSKTVTFIYFVLAFIIMYN